MMKFLKKRQLRNQLMVKVKKTNPGILKGRDIRYGIDEYKMWHFWESLENIDKVNFL